MEQDNEIASYQPVIRDPSWQSAGKADLELQLLGSSEGESARSNGHSD